MIVPRATRFHSQLRNRFFDHMTNKKEDAADENGSPVVGDRCSKDRWLTWVVRRKYITHIAVGCQ